MCVEGTRLDILDVIGWEVQTKAFLNSDKRVSLQNSDVVASDGDGQRITRKILRHCGQTQVLIARGDAVSRG